MPNLNPILQSSIVLMLITVFVKLLGYGEKLVLAYYLGTGSEVDIYNLVVTILLGIFFLFREIIEPGFLKVYQEIDNLDKTKSKGFLNFAFIVLIVLSSCLCFVFLMYPVSIASFFAPGFTNPSIKLAAKLIQLSGPAIIFLVLSTLTYITLNSYKRFAIAAFGDLLQKLSIVTIILLLFSQYGVYALAIGIIAGAIMRFITHLLALLKLTSPGFHVICEPNSARKIWHLTWPLLIGVIFSQASTLADNIFASFLKVGSISALSYSKKLIDLPVLLLPYALSVVVFPYLSQYAINNQLSRMKEILQTSIHYITIVFIPISIFFLSFSSELIQVVYQRGAFNEYSTQLTAGPFFIYSFALVIFALETIVIIYFFSMGDTKTPVITGIVMSTLNIALTYIFIKTIGYLGISLAYSVTKTIKLGLLLYILNRMGHFHFGENMRFVVRLIFALVLFFIILKFSTIWKTEFIDTQSKNSLILWLFLTGIVSFVPYISFILYPERNKLLRMIKFLKK